MYRVASPWAKVKVQAAPGSGGHCAGALAVEQHWPDKYSIARLSTEGKLTWQVDVLTFKANCHILGDVEGDA
jgi:hypothetical protein